MAQRRISTTLTQTNVHLTKDQLQALEELAVRKVMSKSGVIRELIDKATKEMNTNEPGR